MACYHHENPRFVDSYSRPFATIQNLWTIFFMGLMEAIHGALSLDNRRKCTYINHHSHLWRKKRWFHSVVSVVSMQMNPLLSWAGSNKYVRRKNEESAIYSSLASVDCPPTGNWCEKDGRPLSLSSLTRSGCNLSRCDFECTFKQHFRYGVWCRSSSTFHLLSFSFLPFITASLIARICIISNNIYVL